MPTVAVQPLCPNGSVFTQSRFQPSLFSPGTTVMSTPQDPAAPSAAPARACVHCEAPSKTIKPCSSCPTRTMVCSNCTTRDFEHDNVRWLCQEHAPPLPPAPAAAAPPPPPMTPPAVALISALPQAPAAAPTWNTTTLHTNPEAAPAPAPAPPPPPLTPPAMALAPAPAQAPSVAPTCNPAQAPAANAELDDYLVDLVVPVAPAVRTRWGKRPMPPSNPGGCSKRK